MSAQNPGQWNTPDSAGEPSQQGYGQHGYGQPGYPAQRYVDQPPPGLDYTSWGRRVGAWLIDFLPALLAQMVFFIGYGIFIVDLANDQSSGSATLTPSGSGVIAMTMGFVLLLAALGWQLYNRWLVAGRTGQSLGKRVLGMALVSEQTQQPIGGMNAFLRDLVHLLDGFAYIGYLWPLWDQRRQTFADKLMKTIVVDSPQRGSESHEPTS